MIFWTWAKGLEDEFDGSNRRNLRHFISFEAQISEKPTQVALPSVRSGDGAMGNVGISEMNVATLDDPLKEEVLLFLHRGTASSFAQRSTAGIT